MAVCEGSGYVFTPDCSVPDLADPRCPECGQAIWLGLADDGVCAKVMMHERKPDGRT